MSAPKCAAAGSARLAVARRSRRSKRGSRWRSHGLRQIGHVDRVAAGHDDHPLHGIPQFADVTFPPVTLQRFEQKRTKNFFSAPSLFGLAPCGVCPALAVTSQAVRSYRTFSPLPAEAGGIFSVALSVEWTWIHPPRRYLAHCSLEFGLSSCIAARDRPVQLLLMNIIKDFQQRLLIYGLIMVAGGAQMR